jgi:hypothetical protein
MQRIVEQQIVPAMQALPGFHRYLGGVNRSNGTITAVSLWDTQAQANFSREVLMGAVPALTAIGVALEPAEIYEITLDT